jgi:hypothetical protein
VDEGQREEGVGVGPRVEAGALRLRPALARRGVGGVEDERQEVEVLAARALEGPARGGAVEVEADDAARAGFEGRGGVVARVAAEVPDGLGA